MAKTELSVGAAEAGLRLDRFLLAAHAGLSRRALALCFAAARVTLNGRPARKGDRVHPGDLVTFDPEEAEVVARPSAGEAELVLVTPEFVVMNKPAGLPSLAAPGRVVDTAAGRLLHRFPELAQVGYGAREPGLVHRLDTQTSGLLLAARTAAAFAALRERMQTGGIAKRYWAIAEGTAPASGHIEQALEPDPGDARRVRVRAEPGPRATVFRRLEVRAGHSLLEVTLARGYRHQIRAHLASIGHPLVGDVLYGGHAAGLAPRHALHACFMACRDASFRFEVSAELPLDLQTFWDQLSASQPE